MVRRGEEPTVFSPWTPSLWSDLQSWEFSGPFPTETVSPLLRPAGLTPSPARLYFHWPGGKNSLHLSQCYRATAMITRSDQVEGSAHGPGDSRTATSPGPGCAASGIGQPRALPGVSSSSSPQWDVRSRSLVAALRVGKWDQDRPASRWFLLQQSAVTLICLQFRTRNSNLTKDRSVC